MRTRTSTAVRFVRGIMCLAAVCLVSLICFPCPADDEKTATAPAVRDKTVARLFETLPVQDEGRIKPLDTCAGFKLLKLNGRRTCKTPDGKTLTAIEWLLDCLFHPENAREYAVFSVDSSEVIVAIGIIPHEKKRDRYAYQELQPARDKLFDLADEYARIPARDRTTVQNQLVNLAHNVVEYEGLTDYTQFARSAFLPKPDPEIAEIPAGSSDLALSDVLKVGPSISKTFLALRHDTTDKSEEHEKKLQAYGTLLGRLDDVRKASHALALFPPADPASKEWMTPADLVMRAFEDGAANANLELLAAFEAMVRLRDDPVGFGKLAAAFHTSVTQRATQRGEYGKIGLEVSFYKWQFFSRSLVFYILAFLVVALSWLIPRSRSVHWLSIVLLVIPTALLIAGIAMRCVIRGRPPVTTLYETILFTTAVAVVVSLCAEWISRQRIALSMSAVLAVVGMFLANKYEAREGTDTMPSMVAVLDTNFWLATHVTTISIGYAAGLLAGAIAHVYVLGRLLRIKVNDAAFYATLTRMVYGIFCFGFFFTFVGTLLGGIWANESWGRFWGWDPKENGALLIVLWQLAALHARTGGYIRDLGFNLAAIACGMVVGFSWWGVNLLGVGLHSYGFTSGAMTSLMIFWGIESAVIVLGLVGASRQKAR